MGEKRASFLRRHGIDETGHRHCKDLGILPKKLEFLVSQAPSPWGEPEAEPVLVKRAG
jgi:hypothetical protein